MDGGAVLCLAVDGFRAAGGAADRGRPFVQRGRELFLRQDYAAARQTLVRYTRQAGEKAWADEVDYMLACTAYELKMPDCREVLSDYLEAHPESRYRNRVQALIGASYFRKRNTWKPLLR